MKVFKGDDTKRQAPPHPTNYGDAALRAGIKQLEANYAETAKKAPTTMRDKGGK